MIEQEIKEISDFNRLTQNARSIINKGYNIASAHNHSDFLPIHLFIALLESKKGIVEDILQKMSVDIDATLKALNLELSNNEKYLKNIDSVDKPVFSESIKRIINDAYGVSSELASVHVGTEHLFIAMFKLKNERFIKDLNRAGVTYDSLKNIVQSVGEYNVFGGKEGSLDNASGMENESLPFFVKDMGKEAIEGKYIEVIGREKEIKRLVHILSRKTKNNPILVGDAGVGKTAIVEGLVAKLIKQDLPASLLEKRILSLDLTSILAGAKLRGDVEERINYVIQMAAEQGNVILFIDEVHNIVGAGSAGGKDSMDIANILKPHLSSSAITVIGATTMDEYQKYFEDDSALSRRFQPVLVDELDIESSIQAINHVIPEFEKYHNVKIKSDVVESAVKLSHRFVKDRYLPDKAIDILDEAAASVKIGREIAIEPELSKLGERLIEIQDKKESAVKLGDLKAASVLREDEDLILDEIQDVIEGKKNVQKKYIKSVNEELIRQIIVDWTGIPTAKSDISDKTLKDLSIKLKSKIIGQDHIIEKASLAIQRAHLGIADEKRPLASFLFLGPTGVGKTELAKQLARELFGSEELIFRVDMSEMMEMHSVSKLIGSPPGYVGYQEGGLLTKHVKRKPYSVVLFDEIEKAHPEILNIMLQILEEGELTDGQGKKISFSNTVIVMTSNIGAEQVSVDNKLGFDVYIDTKAEEEGLEEAFEEMRGRILEDLKDSVSPEFMNRIDYIDVFRGLNKEDTLKITQIQCNELKVRLMSKGLILNIEDFVVNHINELGYSKEFGGRNIRRKIQDILENGLATFLLSNNLKTKAKALIKISAKLDNEDVVFSLG